MRELEVNYTIISKFIKLNKWYRYNIKEQRICLEPLNTRIVIMLYSFRLRIDISDIYLNSRQYLLNLYFWASLTNAIRVRELVKYCYI